MYEYEKNPSNQSGGSFVKTVTVEEVFDENGRLVSRTTTTEYVQNPVFDNTYRWQLFNTSVGNSTGPHLHFE